MANRRRQYRDESERFQLAGYLSGPQPAKRAFGGVLDLPVRSDFST
jgi:hypothetical protein